MSNRNNPSEKFKGLWRLRHAHAGSRGLEPVRIQPPRAFAAVIGDPPSTSSVGKSSKPCNTAPTPDKDHGEPKPSSSCHTNPTFQGSEVSHRFFGLSLHQGTLPFVTLNGIHITFSPALLVVLAVICAGSSVAVGDLASSLVIPVAFLMLILSQLAGHLLFGWLGGSQAESLILSVSGVIDPGLVFRERSVANLPRLFETEDGTYFKGADVEEDLDLDFLQSQNSHLSEASYAELSKDIGEELRFLLRAPVRALGASCGALFFIGAATATPFLEIMNVNATLSNTLWWYAAFLVVAPFLPPHKMNNGFRKQLTSSLYPLVFFGLMLLVLPEASSEVFLDDILQPGAVLAFILAVLGRKLWWMRVATLSRTAQELPIASALMPISQMVVLTHGDSISAAKTKALKVSQQIFPVVSGNHLTGCVERGDLLRASDSLSKRECVQSISDQQVSLCDSHMSLEVCFSPKTHLPLFVVDEGEVIGVITADSVRDSLLLRLQEKFSVDEDDFDA